jgi:hypothetical protein
MTAYRDPSVRRFVVALVVSGASWSLSALPSFAEGAGQSKPDFSGSFPKKATQEGIPLPRSVDTLKLDASRAVPVTISSKKGCFFGDLDLMLVEMSWSNYYDLRVSLEPLDDGKAAGSSAVITVKDLAPGSHTVSLKAPKVTQPTLMGLYICRDSKKSGSCRGKPVVSPGEFIKRYSSQATAGKKPGDLIVDDKTYYFNHVVVAPDGISSSDSVFDQAEFARVREIAQKESPKNFEQKLKKLYEAQRTLSSVPLKQVDGALAVTLPISDFANCSKQ